jgi:hypothetical protein
LSRSATVELGPELGGHPKPAPAAPLRSPAKPNKEEGRARSDWGTAGRIADDEEEEGEDEGTLNISMARRMW